MYVVFAAFFSGPTGTVQRKLCGPGAMGLTPSQLLTPHWAGLMALPSTGGKPNILIPSDLRNKALQCARHGSKTSNLTKKLYFCFIHNYQSSLLFQALNVYYSMLQVGLLMLTQLKAS